MFCPQCGKELPSETDRFCTYCGRNLSTVQPQTKAELEPAVKIEKPKKSMFRRQNVRQVFVINQKNPGTAALIAFFGGLFGLQGIGQMYSGKVGRGIAILVGSVTLYFFIWMTFLGTIFGSLASRQNLFGTGIPLTAVLVFAYAGLFIWQILDARSCAQKYNEQLHSTMTDESDEETDTEAA